MMMNFYAWIILFVMEKMMVGIVVLIMVEEENVQQIYQICVPIQMSVEEVQHIVVKRIVQTMEEIEFVSQVPSRTSEYAPQFKPTCDL